MSQTIRGVVHGKTIELLADAGLHEGQEVEINIKPLSDADARLAAILRTAGSMADDPEFDAVMDQVQRDRHLAQFREDVE